MARLCVLPVVAALLLAFAGCSTSRGALFDQTVEADRETAEIPPPRPEPDALTIRTDPRGAELYLNNRLEGTTPLVLRDLQPGRYKIEARLPGHRRETLWIVYSGGAQEETLVLEPITGFLDLETHPKGAEITLGSDRLPQGLSEVPVGAHRLTVRAFGYETFRADVLIAEEAVTKLVVTLVEADLDIRNLTLERRRFNPANPGLLGRTQLRFEVTTRGEGVVLIRDEAGREVLRRELPPFRTWEQSFTWDGRDADGRPVPDGSYQLVVEASGPGSPRGVSGSATVIVDGAYVISFRALWSGVSGLLYAGSPVVLPADSLQVSSLLLGHVEADGEYRAPVSLGARIGMGRNVELGLLGHLILENVDALPWDLSISGKLQLADAPGLFPAKAAATGRLTFHHGTGTDTLTTFTGLSVGFPASLSYGPVSLLVMPELALSPFEVTRDSSYDDDPRLRAWAYGRAGLLVDVRGFSAGLSAALRTSPFGRSPFVDLPLPVGAEAHLFIPETQLVLSFSIAGELESADNYYLMSGLGLSLLN